MNPMIRTALITLTVTMETSAMVLALYWGQLMVRGGRRRCCSAACRAPR